jgi:uncharacterized phiE125 gp8 family phage protein
MSLTQTAGPALEPVTLAEAKLYARVDGDADDETLTLMIGAARELFERETGLVLIRQSFELTLDCWPMRGADSLRRIYLPVKPVLQLTSLTVTTSDGEVTVESTDYVFDAAADQPRLVEASAGLWPSPSVATGGIVIAFDAGFGDAAEDVPAGIRLALLKLIADSYERRAPTGETSEALNASAAAILAPFREVRL